jgi:tetratricopeptide (TPR) repeat protein
MFFSRKRRDKARDEDPSALLRAWKEIASGTYSALEQKDYANAPELAQTAISRFSRVPDPEFSEYFARVATHAWCANEHFGEGIVYFTEQQHLHPDFAWAYNGRAALYWYNGQTDQAVIDFEKALQLNTEEVGAHLGLGQLYADLGNVDAAMKHLDVVLVALVKMPHSERDDIQKWRHEIEAYARNGRGVAFAASSDLTSSLAEFEKSIFLSPQNAWVYFNRARVLEANGRQQDALRDYRTSLEQRDPALTPKKREYANTRLRHLSS